MTLEIDAPLRALWEQREHLRIQINLATHASRPDKLGILADRATLSLLELKIKACRRAATAAALSGSRSRALKRESEGCIPGKDDVPAGGGQNA